MKKVILSVLMGLAGGLAAAQAPHTHLTDRSINFPGIPGYLTLKADLHMHTVFSDGDVWPSIRVEEALRDSLDIIAITEHLEYQPHQDDIPHPDRNRAYQLARQHVYDYAAYHGTDSSLLVIAGSEITRSMPPGHANAIFLSDANKLLREKPIEAFREAHRQGAFVFWNHPHWTAQQPDGKATLTDMHRKLIKKGYLHGIEVVNETTYSVEALQIALEHNLTILGTSDIHGLIDWQYRVHQGGHRPVTLVFARERSAEAVKEALFAGRTAVWFNNTLIGRSEWVIPLIKAAVTVVQTGYLEDYKGPTRVVEVVLKNNSDVTFLLYNKGDYTFHAHDDVVMLEPHSLTTLLVKPVRPGEALALSFTVLNAVVGPDTHPDISWEVNMPE